MESLRYVHILDLTCLALINSLRFRMLPPATRKSQARSTTKPPKLSKLMARPRSLLKRLALALATLRTMQPIKTQRPRSARAGTPLSTLRTAPSPTWASAAEETTTRCK